MAAEATLTVKAAVRAIGGESCNNGDDGISDGTSFDDGSDCDGSGSGRHRLLRGAVGRWMIMLSMLSLSLNRSN